MYLYTCADAPKQLLIRYQVPALPILIGGSRSAHIHMAAVATWLCAQSRSSLRHRLPAFVVYMIGTTERFEALRVFEFSDLSAIGDLLIITDNSSTTPPPVIGPLSNRHCVKTHETPVPAALLHVQSTFKKGRHQVRGGSSPSAIVKLDVLRHISVPHSQDMVVLLDADTYCIGCAVPLLQQMRRFAGPAVFLAASRAGNRRWSSGTAAGKAAAVRRVVVPRGMDGVNTGVLVLNITRFSTFAESFCPSRPWYECAMERLRPPGHDWRWADQSVWGALIEVHREIWRPLPCGLHAEMQVLAGVARCLGVATNVSERAASSEPFDNCHPDTHVEGTNEFGGNVPRRDPLEVVVTHGSGGGVNRPIARAVASELRARQLRTSSRMLSASARLLLHCGESITNKRAGAPEKSRAGVL